MNKAFEKILDRLEDELTSTKTKCGTNVDFDKGICKSQEIVQQVAEEYKGGWIPCSERLPSGLDFVLYTQKDGEVDICSIEYFYDYLDRFTAWQPLPEPFKERD